MACRKIKPISNAALRALWLDPHARQGDIEARAGCSYDTVANRARSMGLPSRLVIRNTSRFARDGLFRAMWRAGVSAQEMARHYAVHQSSISRAAADCPDLAARQAGEQPRITLSAFLETLLAARMQAARTAELARRSGADAVAAPVDLEQLFPADAEAPRIIAQQWLALMAAGLTATEAAARRGVKAKAAYRWAERQGLKWPGSRGLSAAAVNTEWAELHAHGLTARQAASVRGCTADAARAWARKRGLQWACAPTQRVAA